MLKIIWLVSYKTLFFFLAVRIISIIIFIYSLWYLESEKILYRYFLLYIIFVFSIFLVIIGDILILLFFGWEWLGVSSYFLIAYYSNKKRHQSAIVTILSNRLGDIIFIRILVMLFSWVSLLSFSRITLQLIILIFVIGLVTKRALFIFSSWLLRAIAAPTPISALVHSSTLVTAGLFIIMKFLYICTGNNVIILLTILSILTILYSGARALWELDFKKIIALSTISHISLIFYSYRSFMEIFTYYHILSHAFFKRLLFALIGVIIHLNYSQQDYRIFSKSYNLINFIIILTLFSLIGIYFLAGWYTKDGIIESSLGFIQHIIYGLLFWVIVYLSLIYNIKFFYNMVFKVKSLFLLSAIVSTIYLLFFLLITSMVVRKVIFSNIRKSTLLIIANLTTKYILLVLLMLVILIYINFSSNFYLYFSLNSLFTLHNITILLQLLNKPVLAFNRYFEKRILELTQVSVLNGIINLSVTMLNTKVIYLISFIILLLILLFL